MDARSDLGLGPAANGTHPAATRDHPYTTIPGYYLGHIVAVSTAGV